MEPLDYEWDFGDGSPVSTQKDPLHEYASPGAYEVTLTVSDTMSSNSITKPVLASP